MASAAATWLVSGISAAVVTPIQVLPAMRARAASARTTDFETLILFILHFLSLVYLYETSYETQHAIYVRKCGAFSALHVLNPSAPT
jgi:hypothetical protein